MICETCGGARFSEEGYPHHLVEGLDACECDEKPVSEEQQCRQRARGCTGKAETFYLGNWPVCYRCLDRLGQ